jgi:hypothetical protein
VRLLIDRPPPATWRDRWYPRNAVKRCRCGARIIARSRSWSRCDRGCLTGPPVAPAPLLAVPPPQPARPPKRFVGLVRQLRALERDFVRDVRRGRRPAPRALALALEAVQQLAQAFPGHAADLERSLPWLARRRAGAPA